MCMYSNDLNGRTVLVTGASGFIGSHLADILIEQGADVHVLARYSSNMQNLQFCINRLHVHRADLSDLSSLINVCKFIKKKGSPAPMIFHLAAQAHVKQSWITPGLSVNTNFIGTLNLLEAVKETDLSLVKFSFAGSSEEYGNQPSIENSKNALNEESPVAPISPYGATKVAADFLCRNYFDAYGIPTLVVRMFNNYGPRQRPEFITPSVILQAIAGQKVLLGDLRPRRDFLFVRDGARAHIAAALYGKPGEVYCAGFGETISMCSWVDKILNIGSRLKLWSNREIEIDESRFRPGNTELWWLRVDSNKLQAITGWKPSITWDEGLEITIKWFAQQQQI